jgi:50S ribosomal subunit-associated GTPase HflX
MDELSSLAITIDCTIVEQLIIPIRTYNAATLIGKGKVEEIRELIE